MAAVIQEIRGEPGRHNDARLVRQTMKIGLTALTLRPACVLGVFFVKNRLRLIVDCRKANALFAPPPPVELLSGDGFSRIEADTSGLVHGESPGLRQGCADVADCFHRMRLSGEVRHFSFGQGCRTSISRGRKSKGPKLRPIKLSGRCVARYQRPVHKCHSCIAALKCHIVARSLYWAVQVRSHKRVTTCTWMTLASSATTQVHMALNEVGKISRRAVSCYTKYPLALVLVDPLRLSSTSSSCGPFLPWNVLLASGKGSDVF